MVTFPGVTAVRMGGSSMERVTIVVSLDVQVNPVTGWLFEPSARIERVSPTTMLITLGLSVNWALELEGTVKVTALPQRPFCWIFATPLTGLAATVADT